MEWFRGLPQIFSLLQIILDVCLIAAVILLLRKRSRDFKQADDIAESMERIFSETKNLAEGFDLNLRERQELMHVLVAKLDQHTREARSLCEELEKKLQDVPPQAPGVQPMSARHAEAQKIRQLAQKGLDAEAIARRLNKPVGEVQLVLDLSNLADKR